MLNKLINAINKDSNKYIEVMAEDTMKPKELVEELFNNGYIKSDLLDIADDEFYGLRARVKANINKDFEKFEKLIYKIIQLDIKPKVIYIDEGGVDLFFQPSRPINIFRKRDYLTILMEFIDYIENNQWVNMHFIGWNFKNSQMITSENIKDSNTTFSAALYDATEITCRGMIEGTISTS
ncbi:TPA: hypothetical protein KNI71_002550 [Clostridioides difficile]|nr:hypothetical protein [Clostridioides difficile]